MGARRAQILDLAAQRFARDGYEATSIRDIAAEANILPGSIYSHFENKAEMLNSILQPIILRLEMQIDIIEDYSVDPEMKLLAGMMLFFKHVSENGTQWRLFFNERRYIRTASEFEYITTFQEKLFGFWTGVLGLGVDCSLFRKDLNVFISAVTIVKMTNAFSEWFDAENPYYSYIRDNFNFENLIVAEIDFIFHAIRAKDRQDEMLPHAAVNALIDSLGG